VDAALLNQPYHWLKQIPGDLWQQDEIPLLGYSPAFPWDDVAAQISQTLGLEALVIEPGQWQWRSQEELFAGLGNKFKGISLNIAPLEGSLHWVMPEQEAKRLVNLFMTHYASLSLEHIDEIFHRPS
jgi:flagellar motor switch protein FliN/FliY